MPPPSIIDRIQQDQLRQDNQDVAQAQSDYRWARSFSDTPPIDVLRDRLNLADTMDRAIGNKLRVQAQSDVKALDLLDKQERFYEWQQQAPLREQLLRSKIEGEGAYSRFQAQKDAETQRDITGFFNFISSGQERPGTPETDRLNQAIQQFPRVIGTQVGQDALKNLQREHDDLSSIVGNTPAGTELDRIDIGDDGRAKAVFRPITPKQEVPGSLVPLGATTDKRGDVSIRYGTPKEAVDSDLKNLEKNRDSYAADFAKARVRRESAGKQLEKARTLNDQGAIQNAMDLVNAADADITHYQSLRDKAETDLQNLRKPKDQPSFKSADEIRAAFKNKSISREQAEALLKSQFGFE